MNTMVAVGSEAAPVCSDGSGTVALLKALELIWIIMVYDSGEVVMSLESEVIWGLIILIGFFLS